ncbi:phage terminase small subunit [Clostridium kluyveri]|uniref:Terminase n=1 Tax=Clostridium kluyveri TaxID=1534 RepID=A0A1L5FEE1_CLOKL|nr:phage terminase small subunit [Clostridium kluyveri]APM41382.1 terminase [Clostridium kluyveri]
MPRQRSPNRDKAKQMYLESGKTLLCKDIAKVLNVSESQVRNWKAQDNWDNKNKVAQSNGNSCATKRKKGGQPQNKNSKGHVSSVPKGNKNAESHGFFSKIFPPETMEVVKDIMIKDPLDMLWENIIIQYTAIARSQRIMDVKSKEEMIKELKKSKIKTKDRSTQKTSSNESEKELEYEFQFAWDRQATFLKAQSRAMSELRSLIKQHDEMVHNNPDMATEEQRLRVEKLRVEIEKVKNPDDNKPIEIMIKRKSDE